MNNEIWILALPCGCVADGYAIGAYIIPGHDEHVVECPWCGATFFRTEFNEWSQKAAPRIAKITRQKPLLLFGSSVLEFVRRCDGCDEMLVRERRGSVEFHLGEREREARTLCN